MFDTNAQLLKYLSRLQLLKIQYSQVQISGLTCKVWLELSGQEREGVGEISERYLGPILYWDL